MGAGAIAKVATDALDPIVKDLSDKASKLFQPMINGYMKTDAGKFLADIHMNQYLPKYSEEVTNIIKNERAKLDSNIKFQSSGAEGPVKPTLAPEKIHSIASQKARVHAYGKNDALIVAAVKSIEKDPKYAAAPLKAHIEQQNLADHVAMSLHDTVTKFQKTKAGYEQQTFSSVKKNIVRNRENAVVLNTRPVYTAPSALEKFASGYAAKVIAPLIAIPHLGTAMNYMLTTPLRDLGAGFGNLLKDSDSIHKFASDMGLLKSTALDAYAVRYNGSKGILANVVNPEFGATVNQLTHQPGFNSLREWTISLGAASGKHTVERAAENFTRSGGKDASAALQLKMLGLEPNDILKQQGKLSPEQLKSAIYKYVDDNVFLDQGLRRSFYSGANPFTRMTFMYHGYITRQSQLMRRVIFKDSIARFKAGGAGNYAMLAQSAVALGVVFPAVGLGLKQLERWGRGQWDIQTAKNDFENATGQNGAEGLGEAFLDGYMHMAAFGVAGDYTQSMTRHMLAQSVSGPLANIGEQTAQDGIYPMYRGLTGHSANFEPLGRDLLEYSLPDNLGKIAAHQLLPTAAEEKLEEGDQ